MRLRKISFWKRWLLHSFLIWFIGNLLGFCNFLYKSSLFGGYLINGEPANVSERFKDIFDPYEAFSILLFVLIIEINYYYFYRKKKWVFLLSSLVTGLIITGLAIISVIISSRYGFLVYYMPSTFVIAFAFPFVMEFIDTKIFKAERLLQHSTAELNALKAQINPHFFFNTLNGIYGTALKEEATDTASAIEKLSGMMRYILTEGSGNFVPVKSELKFVSEYIELQKMRIPQNDHIQLKTTIDYDEQHALIAPLLLLSLIENAFQYAISMESKSFIVLNILVQKQHLTMYIRNSINSQPNKGTGIGIVNVKRRLELLYPGKYELNIATTVNEYTVQLQINL